MQMREATILDAGRAFLPTPHAFRLIASPQATLLGEELLQVTIGEHDANAPDRTSESCMTVVMH